ncbi:MAG TPA: prenyltransferase/squalene oxidase repeat-containing protein [Methanothrix soehngenii]|nr:prenyltransferase/squalene oxidase repeat-containing protein [Methanothrix soehngenii]
MPDIQALIRYINERQIKENDGSGYSFVRDLPPTIRDTFFALDCLKMLKADSPDERIISFLSEHDRFDFNGTYYAMKCLKLAGAEVDYRDGNLLWTYRGDEQQRACSIPNTPLIRYFESGLYGMYGSSIFSSSLSAILKRIELGADIMSNSLINSAKARLTMSCRQDIMSTYIVLEILKAMGMRGHSITRSSSYNEQISDLLKRCTTRRGYAGNPNSSSVTLESAYAGHRIAQYLKIPDPLGIASFVDSLQNANGGFRGSYFGGISTLESCYLAVSIITD